MVKIIQLNPESTYLKGKTMFKFRELRNLVRELNPVLAQPDQ